MTQIVLNQLFTKANKSLDGSVKSKVLDFITKLQHDPSAPGLDLKKPQGATDPRVRTARVNDFWRAVLFELPESAGYVLASVKPHDDAYLYVAQLRMQVNEATGALELFDQMAVDEAVDKVRSQPQPSDTAEAPRPLLEAISVTKLRAFGLSDDMAEQARQITDEDTFNSFCDALPELQGCALLDLLAGKDPDEVYQDLVGQEPVGPIDTTDVQAALQRPSSRLEFARGTPDELLAAIEGDLSAWRIWLHPLQRRLAYHDGWNGPFRVTGGAGTGKTVTALHRARHLAERDVTPGTTGPVVLVATFTRNLADALGDQLRELAGADITRLVDVFNLDALAYRILVGQGGSKPRLVADNHETVRQAWDLAASGSVWEPEFLREEWLDVVLAQGVADQGQYLKAQRVGRGVPLNRAKRVEVWGLIEKAQQHLTVSGVLTFTQAAARAADIASGRPDLQYPHAVVDEAQDLHPAHWRLIRALVPPGPDDLFLVGDAHQRIYGRPLVLSRFGIETRGRSRRLTINYRTSEQILRWCVAVMTGATVDDLEGGTDSLVGARSEFTGPDPVVMGSAGPAQEDSALVSQVSAWLDEGFAPESIGVLSRSRSGVDAALNALRSAGIGAELVDRFDTSASAGSVQVMTMHRAKGLEFRCVAITRLGQQHFPVPGTMGGTTEEREQRRGQERAVLYVAGSRARERLALLHSDAPSALLAAPDPAR